MKNSGIGFPINVMNAFLRIKVTGYRSPDGVLTVFRLKPDGQIVETILLPEIPYEGVFFSGSGNKPDLPQDVVMKCRLGASAREVGKNAVELYSEFEDGVQRPYVFAGAQTELAFYRQRGPEVRVLAQSVYVDEPSLCRIGESVFLVFCPHFS